MRNRELGIVTDGEAGAFETFPATSPEAA